MSKTPPDKEPMDDATRRKANRAFESLKEQAGDTLNDEAKLGELLSGAESLTQGKRNVLMRAFGENFDLMLASLRLLKAWGTGNYREVPWKTLLTLSAAIAYLVMPVDAIPDVLVPVGFLDDASVFALALKFIRDDLQDFTQWEARKG